MQAAAGASLTPDGDAPVADVSAPTAPRRLGLLVGTALTAWSLDVVTKIVAVHALGSRTEPVTLVPAVLDLTLTRNPGAAFSVATSMTAVLTVVAFGVVAVVLRLAVRVRGRLWALAFGLLLGGALGNLTDRMLRAPGPFRGHVVDFLRLPHWPVFNLADSCIVVAAVLIAWQSLRGVPLEGGTSTAAVDDDHR